MKKELSYNTLQFRRVLMAVLYIVFTLGKYIIGKEYLESIFPLNIVLSIIDIAVLLFYVSLSVKIESMENSNLMIIEDEMTEMYKAKADKFTIDVIMLVFFIVMVFSMFKKINVNLGYEVILCIIFAIGGVGDGYYLYLEKKDSNG